MVPHYDVVSLFPPMFEALTGHGITRRALDRGLYDFAVWNPRDFTEDNYRTVDDRPYGGGPGMVMLVEPLAKAVGAARRRQQEAGVARPRVVLMSPQGSRLTQAGIGRLGQEPGLVLVAGRYEGVDERFIVSEVDEELSIGDYVLSGGELPAMVVLDCLIRQLPGALGDADSAREDSFMAGLLDCPHYTRPEVYGTMGVPSVLMSGHHAEIKRWRLAQSLARTAQRRPELLKERGVSAEERKLLGKGAGDWNER